VIARAREVLRVHEESEDKVSEELSPGAATATAAANGAHAAHQIRFTEIDESVVAAIRGADLNKLTPLEAMNLLAELQKQLP